MSLEISHIVPYFPKNLITNEALAKEFNTHSDVVFKNTGIKTRYFSEKSEISSDMAVKAANLLFEKHEIKREDIDFLIFCSEGFDYIAPATSCLLQDRLGLSTKTGCIDIPYGCSGFVYGLGIAYGLLTSKIAKKILFITADIPSKGITKNNLELRSIFSDIATASIIKEKEDGKPTSFVYGTDGSGAYDLYIEASGYRPPRHPDYRYPSELLNGEMIMNGTNVFLFSIKRVPILAKEILEKNQLHIDDIDLFIFHQASFFILEVVRKKLSIPKEKMFINITDRGNSVSSSIPLAIYDAEKQGVLKNGMKIMLLGFGIGYSWGATIIDY